VFISLFVRHQHIVVGRWLSGAHVVWLVMYGHSDHSNVGTPGAISVKESSLIDPDFRIDPDFWGQSLTK